MKIRAWVDGKEVTQNFIEPLFELVYYIENYKKVNIDMSGEQQFFHYPTITGVEEAKDYKIKLWEGNRLFDKIDSFNAYSYKHTTPVDVAFYILNYCRMGRTFDFEVERVE